MDFAYARKRLVAGVGLIAWLLGWLLLQPGAAHAAAESPPSLLITEVMVESPGSGEPYRYIELYNNSDRSIDLSQMKILYYYQAQTSDPWANSAASASDIVSAGRATDMYIHPYSTKIVWLLTDTSKTVADFNTAYGTSLGADQFVYTQSSGWAYTYQRYLVIAKSPYDKVNDRITFVRYNADAGLSQCSGSTCDFAKGESVDYYYPSSFNTTSREMERRSPDSLHRTPTPGTVSAAQVPTVPGVLQITEAMIESPGSGEPYRYLEIYNNSNQSIDLSDKKILYYYQAQTSDPWANSAASASDIVSAGRATDMYIHPYSTKIVWLLTDTSKTVADFNAAYGTSLTADQFVYTQSSGWAYTYQRYLAIAASPYDKVINRYSFIRYNADAGLSQCSGSTCDFVKGESVDYYYPPSFDTNSREMVRKKPDSLHQAPSPGALKTGQVPPKPATQEQMTLTATMHTANDDKYLAMSTPGPVIPGLKQGYVPQGMDYYAAKDWLLITYYSENGDPSLLAVVNRTTGSLVKSMRLYKDAATPYTEHAAGIAVSQSHAWISSWIYAYQLRLQDIEHAVDNDKLIFSDAIKLESKAGSMGFENGVLWVGEFGRYDYATDAAHHMTNRLGETNKAWMVGFKLNASDTIDRTRLQAGTAAAVPDYILSIPDEIQGEDFSGSNVILTKSYGPQYDSQLLVYNVDLTSAPDTTTSVFGSPNVPVWFLDDLNLQRSVMAPPMAEGVFQSGGNVYVLYESAAPVYTDAAAYAYTYPLDRIYLTNTASLLSGTQPAQTVAGKLLITETVLSSADSGNNYRYIELYNNSSSPVDLTDYRIHYYWNPQYSDPWNYTLLRYLVHDAGRGGSMVIQPYSTKIIWLLSDTAKTVADFNTAYGTSWTADKFAYITGDLERINPGKERSLAIVGPLGEQNVDRYTWTRYNVGAGETDCTLGGTCDFNPGQSVVYYYPATFDPVSREMERRSSGSLHQTPTPGTLVTGQVP